MNPPPRATAGADGAVDTGVADPVHTGGYHCGAVRYRARGLRDLWYCHCRQCRSLNGHQIAACWTTRAMLEISGEVVWTPVSEDAAHGFCPACHSPLLLSYKTRNSISVLGGSLDHAEGIVECGHFFVSKKGDYYNCRWPAAICTLAGCGRPQPCGQVRRHGMTHGMTPA